ncbi:MAG: acetylxylan esterase [Planctomycetia bacterium]|nr:acetylxylan esterase [Planctomycetia bacterium]
MDNTIKLRHIVAALCLASPMLLAVDSTTAQTPLDSREMRAEVDAIASQTHPPKVQAAEGCDSSSTLKAIFFDGPDFEGKPTKIFAWLGTPEKSVGKVPAVVLLHGGGGSASKGWVQNWSDRGYAAISMSLEGHTDHYDDTSKKYVRNRDGGPARPGIFGDSAAPIKDQWMYQCVAIAGRAAALLRSLPEVDPDKVGIVGVSWGGIITATVIGIDTRYAFAIAVYGCGGLDAIPNQYGANLANNAVYKNVWDSNLRLERARMPILWLSWPEDTHFPMDALALSRQKKVHGHSMLCLIPGMGHGGGASDRPESFTFVENILNDGRPWIVQTSSKLEAGNLQASFDSTKLLDSAVLVSTTDSGITGSRKWIESPASVRRVGDRWVANAFLPAGTTACFINVKSGHLVATSDYQAEEQIKAAMQLPSGIK